MTIDARASVTTMSSSGTSSSGWGLRGKLMVLLAAISSATAVTVGIVSYQSMHERLQTEIDRSLVEATDRFLAGPNRDRRWRIGDRLSIVIPDRPLGIEQYVVHVASDTGDVIASTPGVSLPALPTSDDQWQRVGIEGAVFRTVTSAEGDRYRVRSIIVSTLGNRDLVLQLGRDYSETDSVLADLRTRIFAIGIGVVVIAVLIGAAFSSGVTSRLRRLSGAAQRITETGELALDIAVEGTDETGRLARSFKDMVQALQQSRSQQQRLVQDAGHELRTPLTSLRTNIDVLRRHNDLADDVRAQILADLEHDISELGELVEEIVAVAAHSHTPVTESESTQRMELGEVVSSVVDRFRRRSDREIRLEVDRSWVEIRPTIIERAVANLLDNSIKFTSRNVTSDDAGIDVEVRLGTVTVRDSGPGIPEAELDMIFDRFHRSDEARAFPGSGLGLAIVADAARSHGGGYFARRRPGGGSEVGFWLPSAGDELSPLSHRHPAPFSP